MYLNHKILDQLIHLSDIIFFNSNRTAELVEYTSRFIFNIWVHLDSYAAEKYLDDLQTKFKTYKEMN